jgi:hypothetical protein
VIAGRESHPDKQYLQIVSREAGIQIDESDEHLQNAEPSIRKSLESDSNVIVERDVHP